MNRLFCIILLFYANACLGQVLPSDSLKLKIAHEFLKKRLGDKIVREKIAFAGVYEGMLDLVTFELKSQEENNKNLIVVFFDG